MNRNACRSIVGVITVLLALISSAFAQVVINEVHYRPAAAAVAVGEDPARLEFVELYNSGAAAVDVSGWSIGSAVQFTFPGGTLLAPDAYIVVARDPALLKARSSAIPPGVQVLAWKSGDLWAGTVQLRDASPSAPAMADQVAYSDKGLWPSAPSGSGPSLELLSAKLDNTNPRAWRASTDVNGTPGMRNSQASDGPIVIDETPTRNTTLGRSTEISVTFSEAVKGVLASDLVVDGVPATGVAGSGAGPYVFAIDAPKPGHIPVTLNGGGIASFAGSSFAGDSWFFDTPLPTVMSMPLTARGLTGAHVRVPIVATPADFTHGIFAFDMVITYDKDVLQVVGVTIGDAAKTLPTPPPSCSGDNFIVTYHVPSEGTLKISEYSQCAQLQSAGEIAVIDFVVLAPGVDGTTSNLTFSSVSIQEGAIPVAQPPGHGLFTVSCVGAGVVSCNDGNLCTTGETCQAGVCGNSSPTCNDNNPCTVDTCDPGTGACTYPAGNAGTECRASAGQCDVAESCTGSSGACPANGFQPNTTTCVGTSNGDACDGTDSCNGSGACIDGYLAATTECRASAGQCDVAESCTGTSGACPGDARKSNGAACPDDGNVCTTDLCNGTDVVCIHNPGNAGTECNPSSGACDVAETCTGISSVCPAKTYDCSIGGNVYYYINTPAAATKPVSGVQINMTGAHTVSTSSNGAGAYGFSNLHGGVTVTPAALWGGDWATDDLEAIGSSDASAIARFAVQIITLTDNQKKAGDVTGDNTISAYDASYVARYAVQLVHHFPVAITKNSDWVFTPLANSYTLTGNQTGQNFLGILYGDVTGNWHDPILVGTPFAASAVERLPEDIAADNELSTLLANRPAIQATRGDNAGPAVLSMNGSAGVLRMGERRQITISLQDAEGILGLDMSLGYDASRIRIVDVQGTGLGTSFIWAKAAQAGTYKIAGYGIDPLAGSGQLLTVTVEALKNGGGPNLLSVHASANEGAIPLDVRAVGNKPLLSR